MVSFPRVPLEPRRCRGEHPHLPHGRARPEPAGRLDPSLRLFDPDPSVGGHVDSSGEGVVLTREDIERLADRIAALHRAAPLVPGSGDAGDLRGRIARIAGAIAAGGEEWRFRAETALAPLLPLVERRCRAGRIRRCHGAPRLGGMTRIDGQDAALDALDCDTAIDPLQDLAGTLADLLIEGRRDLANGLLNRYLAATRDYAGLPMMPLFLSMRGAARARAADLEFARQVLEPKPRPRLVCVGGLSGAGKSTLARALAVRIAPWHGAIVLRSDMTRKRLAGVAPEVRLDAAGYSAAMDAKVLRRLAIDGRAVLRAGQSLVVDATFLDPAARDCAARLAREAGARFDGLWLDLPPGEAARRVSARVGDASDATADVVFRQARNAARPEGWRALAADGEPGAVFVAAERALG